MDRLQVSDKDLVKRVAHFCVKKIVRIGIHDNHTRWQAKKGIDHLKEQLALFLSPEHQMFFLDFAVKDLNRHIERVHQEHITKSGTYTIDKLPRSIEYLLFVKLFVEEQAIRLPNLMTKNQKEAIRPRNKVFVSYSQVDVPWLEQLKRHFRPFANKIDFWEDSRIQIGTNVITQINQSLEEAKVAILLLSADYFASDALMNDQLFPLLDRAEEDGATILSVVVKPCLLELYPSLQRYQLANSPNNTIIQMDEATRELTWMTLVKTVSKLL